MASRLAAAFWRGDRFRQLGSTETGNRGRGWLSGGQARRCTPLVERDLQSCVVLHLLDHRELVERFEQLFVRLVERWQQLLRCCEGRHHLRNCGGPALENHSAGEWQCVVHRLL